MVTGDNYTEDYPVLHRHIKMNVTVVILLR